jgi:hypothetical protein
MTHKKEKNEDSHYFIWTEGWKPHLELGYPCEECIATPDHKL